MIIIKKESDIKKLKKGDPRVSQEYLDTIESMTWELDADKIKAVHDKWDKLVDEHIQKEDEKKVKEYNDSLKPKESKKI